MFVNKREGVMETLSVLPKVENILIHTGNIINWNHLKGTVAKSAPDEVYVIIFYAVLLFALPHWTVFDVVE